ncbi:MAG: gamma-glutamyltransferase, partial [Alphaproteobacteria bacterium]
LLVKLNEWPQQNYRKKFKICTMPLPSGGVSTLQIMGILNNFSLANYSANSVEAIHLISQAIKLAYADRKQYLGDVNHKIIDKLLAQDYLVWRAKLIDLNYAQDFSAGNLKLKKLNNQEIFEKPSTTHFSIVDSNGNVVALTSSIEYFFGSGLMVDGFVLNNQLTDFALNPYDNSKIVANAIAPSKQPLSSMSPTFVFDDKNNLIIALGSPGGPRITQFIVKTLVAMLDWNLDIQSAISLPNFAVIANRLELEDRTELVKLKKQLEKLNHQVVLTDITSGINGIAINNHELLGGADPRRNGYVASEK